MAIEEEVLRQAEKIRKLEALALALFTSSIVLHLSVRLPLSVEQIVERLETVTLFHGMSDQTRSEAIGMLKALVSSGLAAR